jgi:FKBP-type peptidyl-prolyl cis-trans isomerase
MGYTVSMKYKYLLILMVLLTAGCKQTKSGSPIEGENFDKDASYALGINIAAGLAYDGIIPNLDEFFKGMRDSFQGKELRFAEEEAMHIIQEAYYEMMDKKMADTITKENEFLAENSTKPGITLSASGLQYEIIRDSDGPKPTAEDMVRVNYEGRLLDGTIFDSSYERGNPVEFWLNRVIPGWTEGLQLMGVGSKYKFYIPSNLGYGATGGGGGIIPPHSTLIFEVELLDIINFDEEE